MPLQSPASRKRWSLAAMALFGLALLGLDLLLVTRGEAVTLAVREQLKTGVGPGLTIGDAALSLSGIVTLADVRFSPGGRQVAVAPEAQIELDVLRGQPKSIRIPRLDLTLDPDRMRDLEAWTPAESSGAGSLPLILVDRGTVTFRHPFILAEGVDVRFDIRDGEIVKREGAPLRAYLEIENELFGLWRFRWTSVDGGFEARISTDRLLINPEFRKLASPRVLKHLDKIKPEGPAAVEVVLRSRKDSDKLDVVVRVLPMGMDLSYAAFPYRLKGCEGELELYPDGALVKHLKGKTTGGETFLSGRVDGYEWPGSFHFDIRIDGMAIDDRLLEACSPELRSWFESFELKGLLRLRGNIVKERGENAEVRVPALVELVDSAGRYKNFPYPLTKMNGTMFVDFPTVRVDRLRARAQDAEVDIWGDLDVTQGRSTIDLRFDARGLPLDAVLRSALPASAVKVFDDFQPGGRTDVQVRLLQAVGESEPRYHFLANLIGASARYAGVPLPVDGLSGRVEGRIAPGDVRVQWDAVRGRYRESDLRLSGDYSEKGERRETNVEVRASNLPITEELTSALPEGVRTAIVKTAMKGTANARLEYGSVGEAARFSAEIGLMQAAFEIDVPIREVEGKLYLTGSTQRESGGIGILGRIDLSNARVIGKRFSSLSGSLLLHQNRLTLSNILGTAYDGVVTGRLSTNLDTGEFEAGGQASGIDLQQMRQDTEGYRQKSLAGRLTITIPEVRGSFGKRDSIRGSGELTVWDGSLWSVPIFLKVLSLDISKWGSSSKFDAGVVKFDIKEEKFKIRSAIFRSEEASLIGEGYLDFDLNMNLILKVETEPLGDFWLFKPINVLINLFSNSFWGVEVQGSFDDPSVGLKLFPRRPK